MEVEEEEEEEEEEGEVLTTTPGEEDLPEVEASTTRGRRAAVRALPGTRTEGHLITWAPEGISKTFLVISKTFLCL